MSLAPTSAPAATVRVLVAADPFLLRTALFRALSRDDRFEVVLQPAGAPVEPVIHDAGLPTVVLASGPLDLPGACVVTVDPAGGEVHVGGDGPCAAHRYEDLHALGELLHRVLVDRGLVQRTARPARPAHPGDGGPAVPAGRRGDRGPL